MNRLISHLVFFFAVLIANSAIAQAPTQIWLPPRLVINSATDQPVHVQVVRINIDIRGRHALTEIDLTFFNPNRRVLEGELQFPLLDGQQVAGFAMDVNGVLRDAVPVDKARGQAVFEDIVRGNVDPGLLEKTTGNNFKLRVYPIPAQGTKRVVLRIGETLADRRGRSQYRLPLGFGNRIDRLAVDASVAGTGAKPVAHSSALAGLSFVQHDGVHRLHQEQMDFTASESAALDITVPVGQATVVSMQAFEGRTYYMADVAVPAVEMPRTIPRVVGLLWDASGSGAERNHVREFALLDAYFRRMQQGEVRLTRMRHVAEAVEVFQVRDGDWSALRQSLKATDYDGATNPGAFTPEAAVREYLLFSDGLGNFGDTPFAKTAVPLHTVNAALKSDPGFLRHIAERSGGRLIDLMRETADGAARLLLNQATQISVADESGVSQSLLDTPHAQDGRVLVAGIVADVEGAVTLRIARPGAKPATLRIPINTSSPRGTMAAALWARLRLAGLDAEYALNLGEIRRLGQRFRLVTRETSLIVLDRVEDYARYEITPPAELRADYDRVAANVARQRNSEKAVHLEQIVRLFEEKVRWWNRDFPQGNTPAKEAKIALADSVAAASGRVAERREQGQSAGKRELGESRSNIAATSPVAPAAMAPSASAQPAAPALMAKVAGNIDATSATSTAVIRLQKWQPDSPGMRRIRDANAADRYRVYLDEKPGNASSTAFFLDAADVFIEQGQAALGLRILTNLAEMDLENRHILRILGYRLMQAKQPALAIPVLRKVLALSPDEPQSYRDLGLAYAADRQLQKAVDSFNEVVVRPWHGRFPEVELITLAEMNSVIASATASNIALDLSRIEPRLLKNLQLDLRAVLTWDADNTDIDLWVTDPNGEKAYYGNRLTYQGGRMSQDFTGGYGPEEFSLKHAKPGKYKVEAQYFGDRRQNVTGATTLSVRLSTHFGTPGQQDQLITLRLKDKRDVVFVGEFEIK